MGISARAKLVLALVVLLGMLVYLVVLDLGIYAGRIHRGVSVRGIDVGGLTREEATSLLTARGVELESEPVFFTREGFECEFLPTELGWDAKPFETAVAAFRIGRGESPLRALGTRLRAWFGDVKVDWTDQLKPAAVTRFIDWCEERAVALGYDVKRYRFRQKIRRAITTLPRRPFNIPIRS